MADQEHLSVRPGWQCQVCSAPWPCSTARTDLRVEYRRFPTVLRIYLAAQMCAAIDDMRCAGGPVPDDLYLRFLGWAR
ncbi:hypothetical protein [Actinoplanes sp. NPDC026619]|uniref:hypothetical protein n=1 Tax=Actinoplanes sp. NPDC026619 TaxID=3155798 RepID=UPI003407DC3C